MQPLAPHPQLTPQQSGPGGSADPRKLLEDIQRYLGVVTRGWRFLVVGLLVAATAAVLHISRSQTMYKASARLLVIQQGNHPVSVTGGTDPFQRLQQQTESLATHLIVIRSTEIVTEAVQRSGLTSVTPAVALGGLTVKMADPAARVVDLTYTAASADEASKILDGVIESYNEFLKKKYQNNTSNVISLIARARDEAERGPE